MDASCFRCNLIIFKINKFKKRQDLVSMCTSLFLFNEKDRVIFDAGLTPVNDIPIIFCICKKKDVKALKKAYSDIVNIYN
jgi:hypothetical protein